MTLAPPRHDDRQPPEAGPAGPKLGISPIQVIAAALAAATATVAASFLGIAGTVIGAALASVISVTGTALYSHSFRRTRDRVRERVPRLGTAATRPVRLSTGPGRPRPGGRAPEQPPRPGGFTAPTYYGQRRATSPRLPVATPPGSPGAAPHSSQGAAPRSSQSAAPASATSPRTRWRRLAAAAAVVFVAVLLVVTVVELAAGSPLTDLVRGRAGSGTTFFGTHHAARHTAPSKQPHGASVLPSGSQHPHRSARSPAATATRPPASSAPASSPTPAPPSTTPSTSATPTPSSTLGSPTQSAARPQSSAP